MQKMKKIKILTICTICILITIPFVQFSNAQPSTYVGVEEGDEYTWKINFEIDGMDQLVNNTRQVLVDQINAISTIDLYGFESLTISESIEYVIDTALNMALPPGWEGKNISSIITDIFPPSLGLLNLNFSAFIDFVIDGLNSTMPSGWDNFTLQEIAYYALPSGWENHNITELVYVIFNELNASIIQGRLPQGWQNLTLIELSLYTINELEMLGILPPEWANITITEFVHSVIDTIDLTGILPPGWENETLSDLIQEILLIVVPEGFSFNFYVENIVDYLLPLFIPETILQYSIEDLIAFIPSEILNLNFSGIINQILSIFSLEHFLLYSIDDLFADLPPEILQYTIDDLFALFPPEILNLNISAATDNLTLFLDTIMPAGWDSLSLSSLIGVSTDMVIGMLNPVLATMNISAIIDLLINNFVEPMLSAYIGPLLPLGWESLTILELIQYYMNNLLIFWDSMVVPQWNSLRTLIETVGFFSNEIGLKARVENIENEVSLSPGGPKGVPINLTLLISLDMVDWIPISTIVDSFGIDLSFFTTLPMLVDPSTYANDLIAFIDQMPFTGGLIIAKNYGLTSLSQNIAIPVAGDPNGIVISVEWNNKGLLKSATIEASGKTAFSLELEIEPEPPEPPESFVLLSNAGVPDNDGDFSLTWTPSNGAENYTVYAYSSYITTINSSLSVIVSETTDHSLARSDYVDGSYYFIAVAHNNFGDTLSNCIQVDVELSGVTDGGIPGYNLYFLLILFPVITAFLIRKRLRKI